MKVYVLVTSNTKRKAKKCIRDLNLNRILRSIEVDYYFILTTNALAFIVVHLLVITYF